MERSQSIDNILEENIQKDEQELIYAPEVDPDDPRSAQTFEISTNVSGSETEQLIKEYKRLSSYIPKLNYDNLQEVEDLRVDLSMLQHRIEQSIEYSKNSKDINVKNKQKYLEKLYQEISEKIDTMKKQTSSDDAYSSGEEVPVESLREIDISEDTTKPSKQSKNQVQTQAGSQEPITQRTYFVKEEHLIQAEDRQVEFKHYRYPFSKECKAIILKTIVSMLNTHGGTIMIGVRDQDLSVVGINIDQKQKDEIILQVNQMLQNVIPAVNEEIQIDYIPVKFKWGKWASKTWICRISISQGQLDRFYYIEDSSVHSYVRYQAMCKTVKLKDIINFTYERAKFPREKQTKIVYSKPDPDGVKNCNMEQDAIDNLQELDQQKLYDNKIIFTDIQEGFYEKLRNFLDEKLQEEELDYVIIDQKKHVVLQFENIDSTKRAIELFNLEKDRFVYELRHQYNFKKVLMGDTVKSIVVKNEYTFIIDHIDTSKRESFILYLSDWLKEQQIKHIWLNFKLYLALYVLETEKVSKYLLEKKEEIAKQFGFHQKVFFGFCRDYIIIKNIQSKTELKKRLITLLKYIPYKALVEKDGTTIHVKCKDFYDLLIAFDRIKSAYMNGEFSKFTDHSKIKVFLGFDRYIE
ncbi:hypothetical protein ABPG72_005149 [Tetrahymena utriculariae]